MAEQTGILISNNEKSKCDGHLPKVHDHVNDERVRRVGGQYGLHWLAL